MSSASPAPTTSPAPLNLGYLGSGWRHYDRHPIPPVRRTRWDFVFVFEGACFPTPYHRPPTAGRLPSDAPCLHAFHRDDCYGWDDPSPLGSDVLVLQFHTIPPALAALLNVGSPLRLALSPPTASRWRTLRGDLRARLQHPDDLLPLRLERVLIDLTLLIHDLVSATGRPPIASAAGSFDRWKVERSLAWFEEHLWESPGVDAAAAEVGCSPGHLRKLYARAGFASPQVEFQRRRMAAAVAWLRQGETPKTVAARLGFSEVSAFARAFRRCVGHPPGTERKAAAAPLD